jgi:hypothetical protein
MALYGGLRSQKVGKGCVVERGLSVEKEGKMLGMLSM